MNMICIYAVNCIYIRKQYSIHILPEGSKKRGEKKKNVGMYIIQTVHALVTNRTLETHQETRKLYTFLLLHILSLFHFDRRHSH